MKSEINDSTTVTWALVEATQVAVDAALVDGHLKRAIAIMVAEGATEDFAVSILCAELRRIHLKVRDAARAEREAERQERVAYNISCGMSRTRAEAVS